MKMTVKLIIASIVAIVLGTSGAIYYMYSMTTVYGKVNITKMINKDTISAYSVYSDFYFRVTRYGKEGKEIAKFSEILPTKTDIRYDYTQNPAKIELVPTIEDGSIYLQDDNDDKVSAILEKLKSFAKIYSKLIVIQTPYFFNEAKKKVEEIFTDLSITDIKVPSVSIDRYYEKTIYTPIKNLVIHPYKLNEINKNIKSFTYCKKEWCPNIAEWQFGNNDRIYFQYLKRAKYVKANEFMKNFTKNNKTWVTTTKITNNKIQKYYFEIDHDKNTISSYFMDFNGYIYLLKFRAFNKISFDKYLDDYLKIAFGIYFTDTKHFTNKFVSHQESVVKRMNKTYNEILSLNSKIFAYEIPKNGFHIKSTLKLPFKFKGKTLTSMTKCSFLPWDQAITYYLQHENALEKEMEDKKIILKAYKKYYSYGGLFSRFKGTLKEVTKCQTIECLKKKLEEDK